MDNLPPGFIVFVTEKVDYVTGNRTIESVNGDDGHELNKQRATLLLDYLVTYIASNEEEKKKLNKKEKKNISLRTKPEYSAEWLLNIPLEEMSFLTRGTSASSMQVVRKGEELYNWLKSNNKRKHDHRLFLRNCLLRNFPPLSEAYGATKNAKDYRGF